MKTLIVVLMLSIAGLAQNTAPPDASQNKILKAQHTLDGLQKSGADIQLQWERIQQQQADLQSQYKELAPKLESAKKALKDAEDEAAKALGLDPAKYMFDTEKMVFVPLASPAPPTASAVKK